MKVMSKVGTSTSQDVPRNLPGISKCPSQRDIGKTVGIDKWTGQGGAKISIDELKRRLQQSRCNDSEPLMQKQKEQTVSIPPKKLEKGLRDGLS